MTRRRTPRRLADARRAYTNAQLALDHYHRGTFHADMGVDPERALHRVHVLRADVDMAQAAVVAAGGAA